MDRRVLRITCVHGSRPGGNTSRMLQDIAEGMIHQLTVEHAAWRPLEVETEYICLANWEHQIPSLINPARQKPEGAVAEFLKALSEADGLILATPVHYNNASDIMLRALNWCYYMEEEEGWPLAGIPVGYAAHAYIDGCQSAINAMQNVLMHTKCTTVQDGHYYRLASLMPLAADNPELRWMLTDGPLLGLRVAEAAYRRKYGM